MYFLVEFKRVQNSFYAQAHERMYVHVHRERDTERPMFNKEREWGFFNKQEQWGKWKK